MFLVWTRSDPIFLSFNYIYILAVLGECLGAIGHYGSMVKVSSCRIPFDTDKIIGFVLLSLGVALVFFSLIEMLYVYYGNIPPPSLVSMSDVSLPGQNGTNATLFQGAEISQILNLSFWYLLMFFVLAVGGKIATIGVSMVKDIKVEVKEPLVTPKETKKQGY